MRSRPMRACWTFGGRDLSAFRKQIESSRNAAGLQTGDNIESLGNLQAESDLAQMLSEAGESAERRVKAYGDLEASQLVLYGAGILGQTTLTRLRRLGIEPVAFADDTPDKQGRTISGLRVMKPLDAVAQFGGGTVFVVTILNPFSSFLAVERRLRQVTNTRVISFLHLAWAYPEEF